MSLYHHITSWLLELFGSTVLEWLGVLTALIGIWLTVRVHILCWIFNILSSIIYGYVFYHTKLYADGLLQLFFIGLSIWGWLAWEKDLNPDKIGNLNKVTRNIKIRKIFLNELLVGLLIATAFCILIGFLLARYTEDAMPYPDAICFVTSIWATYLTAKFILENWILWLFTDLFYIIIYIKKGLYPSAILYGFLSLLAIFGYLRWKKSTPKLIVS